MKQEITYFDAELNTVKSMLIPENGWHLTDDSAWNEKLKLGFSWIISHTNSILEFRIPRDSIREEGENRFKSIIPNQGRVGGVEGDGSSLVLPFEHGILCNCANKPQGEITFPIYATWPSQCNMTLYGVSGKEHSTAAIIEDGKYNAEFRIRTCWGQDKSYSMDVIFHLREFIDEKCQKDDCVIRYKKLSGGWQAMGRFYRDYVRKNHSICTLAEKMEGNPALRYAAKAITVRFRLCVKEMPTPILIQTPETQPPMTVFMTFDMVRKVAEEFKRQDVGAAELNLVGWNYGGHDGAFPQLFPVEEKVGGEESMIRNINAIDTLGYPVSLHDNYFDVYELADNYNFVDVAREHDGSMTKNGPLAGGFAYKSCPACATKYAEENFRHTSHLPIKGSYFCDVISILELRKCFDQNHPVDRREAAEHWKKIMKLQHDYFGVSMSEGAREWALPELDRAYLVGLCVDTKQPYMGVEKQVAFDYFDEEIPLFEMVYHGSLIYNCFREGVNSWPGEKAYLRNFAYGGTPLYYYHHIFNPDWDADSGWDKDLRYTTDERLKKDVKQIKRATEDMAKLAPLQTAFINDYIRHSSTLTETVYSNGSRIWVNYANAPCKVASGEIVPAKNLIVITEN